MNYEESGYLMMQCDLRRGYCLDGRLPCDLCDCFMKLVRNPKSITRGVDRHWGRMEIISRGAPIRVKKLRAALSCEVSTGANNKAPEKLLLPETRVSVPTGALVEDREYMPLTAFRGMMFKIKKSIKELICRRYGHDWETYAYTTGYFSYDIEQAGRCRRCHFDTHS